MLKNDESYEEKFEGMYFNAWENDYINYLLVT